MQCPIVRYGYALTLGLAIGASLGSTPAAAHHSFAMYDRSETRTLTGRLIRFIPGANHAQLVFERIDDAGEMVLSGDGRPEGWVVETGPAAQIAEQGITVEAFPIGTIITVDLNPLRDGRPVGVLSGPVIRCGNEMPAGGCTAATGERFGGRP